MMNCINTQTCQIVKVIRKEENWIEAKVKAKVVGGKRWKLRTVRLSIQEYRNINLSKLVC